MNFDEKIARDVTDNLMRLEKEHMGSGPAYPPVETATFTFALIRYIATVITKLASATVFVKNGGKMPKSQVVAEARDWTEKFVRALQHEVIGTLKHMEPIMDADSAGGEDSDKKGDINLKYNA